MATPDYVPRPKDEKARVYESPPWRNESWMADRPADLVRQGQPVGPGMGYPGPDQGFVLKLARRFEGQLALADGEREDDALAGAAAVALRRASIYGRGPVIHDLTIALRVFGFLADGGDPAPELVAVRRGLFEGVASPHHYADLRGLVARVPEWVLRQTPDQVRGLTRGDWRAAFADEAPAR